MVWRYTAINGLLCSVLLALSARAVAAAPAAKSVEPAIGQPILVFDREVLDFGKVRVGDQVSRSFWVTNVGNKPVKIMRLRTSCGCLDVMATSRNLLPKQHAEIRVTLRTNRARPASQNTIYVETDDARVGRRKLHVKYAIEGSPAPRLEIAPRTVNLGLVLSGRPKVSRFSVKNAGKAELLITESTLATGKGDLGWNGEPPVFPVKVAPGKTVEFDIVFTPPNILGPCQRSVVIKSNDSRRRRAFIAFTAYVTSRQEMERLLATEKVNE